MDEDKDGELTLIDLSKIKGGKPFDIHVPWFTDLLNHLGQPVAS